MSLPLTLGSKMNTPRLKRTKAEWLEWLDQNPEPPDYLDRVLESVIARFTSSPAVPDTGQSSPGSPSSSAAFPPHPQ